MATCEGCDYHDTAPAADDGQPNRRAHLCCYAPGQAQLRGFGWCGQDPLEAALGIPPAEGGEDPDYPKACGRRVAERPERAQIGFAPPQQSDRSPEYGRSVRGSCP